MSARHFWRLAIAVAAGLNLGLLAALAIAVVNDRRAQVENARHSASATSERRVSVQEPQRQGGSRGEQSAEGESVPQVSVQRHSRTLAMIDGESISC